MMHLVILLLCILLAVPCASEAALVSLWHLDENTGTTPQDSAGTHHGVFAGSPGPSWVTGHPGDNSGLSFSGDASVVVTNHADFSPSASLSLVAWVNATVAPPPAVLTVMSKILSGTPQWQMILRTNGTLRCSVQSNSTVVHMTTTATLSQGTWTFAACTWGSNLLHVWLNAVEDGAGAATTGTMASNGQNVILGNVIANNQPWVGTLDELRFYNTELTQGDLQTLYGVVAVRHKIIQSRAPMTLWQAMRQLWRPAYAHR